MEDMTEMTPDEWWKNVAREYHRFFRQTNAEIEAELDSIEAEQLSDEQIDRMMAKVKAMIAADTTRTTDITISNRT